MPKSLRRRVEEAVSQSVDADGRDERDDTDAKLLDLDDSDGDSGGEAPATSAIRARLAPPLGPRYEGKVTSRRSLGKQKLDADEAEQRSAEWGDMFEVDDDQDDEDQDDDDQDEEDQGGDHDEDDEDDQDEAGEMFAGLEDDGDESEEEAEDAPVAAAAVDVEREVQRGAAIKRQLQVWEKLLEARIQLHKALSGANRLPRPRNWSSFADAGGEEVRKGAGGARTAAVDLLDALVGLRARMARANGELGLKSPVARSNGASKRQSPLDDDLEVVKKRQRLGWYSDRLATAAEAAVPYRNAVVNRWNDKTRLAAGSSSSFSAFETSTQRQIETALGSDLSRLVSRTRRRRSQYRVLGEEEQEDDQEEDEEVFDDDDFYHGLLRELIARKTEGVTDPEKLGRQWLQVQKLRAKAKKGKVDTRASKGRKTRYDVHAKLINFMAPAVHGPRGWWRDQARNELFSSLFGKAGGVEVGEEEEKVAE